MTTPLLTPSNPDPLSTLATEIEKLESLHFELTYSKLHGAANVLQGSIDALHHTFRLLSIEAGIAFEVTVA